MILIFTFCLYYVVHGSHYQHTTPTSTANSYDLLVPTDADELVLTTAVPSKRTFTGFSNYRFIICLILLIFVGFFSIPVGGLTGFHVFLIARGRTTNEQVTGKHHLHSNAFTRGCWKNFVYLFCQSLYPQLRAPNDKRYNAALFEEMAYGKKRLSNGKKSSTKKVATKVVYELTNNDDDEEKKTLQRSRKKKRVTRHENGTVNSTTHIHVNPIEPKGTLFFVVITASLVLCSFSVSKPRDRPNHKRIKIPQKQVSDCPLTAAATPVKVLAESRSLF